MSETTAALGDLHITSETGPWAMVPIWVLDMGLSGAELAVYVSLRSFANREGGARPYVKTIAERAGVTQRTAEKAITRMRDLGMLSSTQRRRTDGSIAGCSYHLTDRRPVVGASAPPVPADGTPPVQADGALPSQRTEQEHTTEHTRENTPGSASRASDEKRSERGVGVRANDIAVALIEQHGQRIAIDGRALTSLLAPSVANGVPPDRLKRAVRMLLHDGQRLAPWTLQEYVAKVSHVDQGGVAGW